MTDPNQTDLENHDMREAMEERDRCRHERLNEEGICRRCGQDCRGM